MTAIKSYEIQRDKPKTIEDFCYQYFGVNEELLAFMNEDLKMFDDNQILSIKDGIPVFAHESEKSAFILKKYSEIRAHLSGFVELYNQQGQQNQKV